MSENGRAADPSVAACIVNWNTPNDTIECVQSLAAGRVRPDAIIVVDNASTDDSLEHIVSWANTHFEKRAVLIADMYQAKAQLQNNREVEFALACSARNNGFSAGANRAIELAASFGHFDFLWFLNSDTVVEHRALAALLDCVKVQPEVGVVGSTIVFAATPGVVQCAGGCSYNKWTTVVRPFLRGWSVSEALDVSGKFKMNYVYGASMFVRTAVFERIGTFNEEYFLYFEELDLCNRAVSAGFQLGWCKESFIEHKEGQSVKSMSSDERGQRWVANYHENLSTLIYTRRHHPYGFLVAMVARFFGKLAILMVRHDLYLIPALWRAYVDYCLGVNRRDFGGEVSHVLGNKADAVDGR